MQYRKKKTGRGKYWCYFHLFFLQFLLLLPFRSLQIFYSSCSFITHHRAFISCRGGSKSYECYFTLILHCCHFPFIFSLHFHFYPVFPSLPVLSLFLFLCALSWTLRVLLGEAVSGGCGWRRCGEINQGVRQVREGELDMRWRENRWSPDGGRWGW